jgi:23S rRNA (guanosine2251-2'-O)-methyltransferase
VKLTREWLLYRHNRYANFEETVEMLLAGNDNPVVVLLDGVSDVRNFGAIARTCECAGVGG